MSAPKVTPQEAERLVREEGFVYIDVRKPPEFNAGHPAGAYNVPIAEPSFLTVVERAFGKNAKIVVGCKFGPRSHRAAEALIASGFTTVIDSFAGYAGFTDPFGKLIEPGWKAAGLPDELQAQPGRSYVELAKMR